MQFSCQTCVSRPRVHVTMSSGGAVQNPATASCDTDTLCQLLRDDQTTRAVSLLTNLTRNNTRVTSQPSSTGKENPLGGVSPAKIGVFLRHIIGLSKVEAFQSLLLMGFPKDWVFEDGSSLLHVVIQEKAAEILKVLLESGADTELLDSTGVTPVFCAVEQCLWDPDMVILKRLLQSECKVNVCNGKGQTLLLHTVDILRGHPKCPDVVSLLLTHGAKVNQTGVGGQAPLHVVVQSVVNQTGISLLKILLEYQANPNLPDALGHRPLDVAIAQATIECGPRVMAILLGELSSHRHMSIYNQVSWKLVDAECDAMQCMRQQARCEAVETLMLAGAEPSSGRADSPGQLFVAVAGELSGGDHTLARLDQLLRSVSGDCNLNARNQDGDTLLTYAVKLLVKHGNNHSRKSLKILELLFGHGCRVNEPNSPEKDTPLHLAVRLVDNNYGTSIVTGLLELGGDVNAKNECRMSPLHLACSRTQWSGDATPQMHCHVVELLLGKGADPNCSDADYRTPLHHAVVTNMPKLVDLLIRHWADPTCRDVQGKTPADLNPGPGNDILEILDQVHQLQVHNDAAAAGPDAMFYHVSWETSGHLGLRWKALMRTLQPCSHPGETEALIEQLTTAHRDQLREQAYQGLLHWYQKQSRQAGSAALLAALDACEMKDIVQRLQEKFPSLTGKNQTVAVVTEPPDNGSQLHQPDLKP